MRNCHIIPLQTDASTLGNEAKFHVTQDGIFIYLESLAEKGRHLGFQASGELKSASVFVKDEDSKFGAKLIVSTVNSSVIKCSSKLITEPYI